VDRTVDRDIIYLKPSPHIPSLWQELAAILMRKPRPSALVAAGYPAGKFFSVANGPLTSILVPIVLIGLVGDVPLSFIVVALSRANHPMIIHAVIAATYLLSLGWAVAVRSTLRSMPHVVSSDALWIGGCVRISGVIPKSAIARSLHLRVSRSAWMSEQGISRRDVLLASGFDPPNVAVELKDDVSGVVIIGNRRARMPARRWVLLYADSPVGLVEATRAPETNSSESLAVMAGSW
jgi:hypothetical protein